MVVAKLVTGSRYHRALNHCRSPRAGSDNLVQRRSKRSAEHRPACACGDRSNGEGMYQTVKSHRLTVPRRESRQIFILSHPDIATNLTAVIVISHPLFDNQLSLSAECF